MNKRAVIYMRVSTNSQTTDNQRLELEKVADLKGLEIVRVYEDKGISGTHGRDKRPALDEMLKDAARKRFDMLLVWSIDRLGRSTAHVAQTMTELSACGISQYYHTQGVDSSTPYGDAMLKMAAVFAELEKEIIKERVYAGLDRARAEGKTLGRPALPDETREKVIEAKQAGLSIRKIAAKLSISPTAVHNIVKQAA